jgi:uncharacterized membrane protein YphA (DoxX/SURF4 family)
MDIALLTARVLLASVFGVAGLAKLADGAGSRQALKEFGVPAKLAPPLSVLLPLARACRTLSRPVAAWRGRAAGLRAVCPR